MCVGVAWREREGEREGGREGVGVGVGVGVVWVWVRHGERERLSHTSAA